MAKVRRELDGGQYGSTSNLIEELSGPVALGGLAGCGNHPAVLLYGLVHEPVGSAALVAGGHLRPFTHIPVPSGFGVTGSFGYGILTGRATLEIRSPAGAVTYSESYPGPESYPGLGGSHKCPGSNVIYLFRKR
jgi:hypothetical protein